MRVLVAGIWSDWYAPRLAQVDDRLVVTAAETWDEAAPELPRTEVLVTFGAGRPDLVIGKGHVAAMPALRWVQALLAGTDHIEQALADRPDVVLTNASGVHGPQVSELALFMMLALGRGGWRLGHDQAGRRWQAFDPPMLDGKTATIVGLGTIGMRLGPICKTLGMEVIGVSRTPRDVLGFDRVVARTDLVAAASETDYLILILPYDAQSHHLVGRDVLEALPATAYVINVARGNVIDEEALVEALKAHRLAGAGLDVFHTEPLPAESPLWTLENVVITPHMGGRRDGYNDYVIGLVADNLRLYAHGRKDELVNVVERGS